MRAELGSLFMQLTIVGKREYLKPPAIGQYRAIPCIKLMQASGLLQDLDTGTKIQMVRIPQMICALVSSFSSVICTPFTVPCVPTGIKIGVSITRDRW